MSATATVFALALDVPNHTFSFPGRDGAEVPGLADGWSFSSDSDVFQCAGVYGVLPMRAGRAQKISGVSQTGQSWYLRSPVALLPVLPAESSGNRTVYPVWGMAAAVTGAANYYIVELEACTADGSTVSAVRLYTSTPVGGSGTWGYIVSTGGATGYALPSTSVYARIGIYGYVGASNDACSWGFGPVAVGFDHFDLMVPSSIATGPGSLSPKIARSFGVERFGGRTNQVPRTSLRMGWPCLTVAQAAALRFYWSSSRGSIAGRVNRPGGAVPTLVFPGNVAAPAFMVCDWAEDACPVVPANSWGTPMIYRASPLLVERL